MLKERLPLRPSGLAQRPDALLKASALASGLDEKLLHETLRGMLERKNRNLRRRVSGLHDIIDRDREQARVRIEELERSNRILQAHLGNPRASAQMSSRTREQDPELSFRFNDFELMLKEITFSAAFRCVQTWLLKKPAAGRTMRPRKDALLEAERSHQRRRIKTLSRLDEVEAWQAQRRPKNLEGKGVSGRSPNQDRPQRGYKLVPLLESGRSR